MNKIIEGRDIRLTLESVQNGLFEIFNNIGGKDDARKQIKIKNFAYRNGKDVRQNQSGDNPASLAQPYLPYWHGIPNRIRTVGI